MLSGVTARATSWQVPLPHYGSVLIHGDDYNAALLESVTVVIINQGLFFSPTKRVDGIVKAIQ